MEEPESIEEVVRSQKEMQELGQRAWGSKLKSFQLKTSIPKDAGGGTAPAYNTDRSSVDEGTEAPGENKPAGEVMRRVKDHKTGKRGSQQVHALRDFRRPRADNPIRPGNTQPETPRISNEKSQKPAPTPKTKLCPIGLKPIGNKGKRHIKEVHSDATVGCRECPKKYKTEYSRNRHEKKHHPTPHSVAWVDHRSTSTARELGRTRSERRPPAQEPGNDSREELAQCQKGEITGSWRNALQL